MYSVLFEKCMHQTIHPCLLLHPPPTSLQHGSYVHVYIQELVHANVTTTCACIYKSAPFSLGVCVICLFEIKKIKRGGSL